MQCRESPHGLSRPAKVLRSSFCIRQNGYNGYSNGYRLRTPPLPHRCDNRGQLYPLFHARERLRIVAGLRQNIDEIRIRRIQRIQTDKILVPVQQRYPAQTVSVSVSVNVIRRIQGDQTASFFFSALMGKPGIDPLRA